jgi:lipoprotein-releasing system ATP-binding protein
MQGLQYRPDLADEVLHDIDLKLEHGEFLALIGPSGSGKSTLLNIVGRLTIKGHDTGTLWDAEITHLRGHTIGFVFQSHLLISAFTAQENVMMPMLVERGFPNAEIEQRAQVLLAKVGLEKVAGNLASNMSGGQQQRVAVARALAMNPDLVLADEPTGNLDTKSADSVFGLMRQVNRDSGTSFLADLPRSGSAHRRQELADFQLEPVTVAGQHLCRREHLR